MAQMHVPPLMRDLTAGQATVRAPGRTVAEVIDALDAAHPGFKDRLMPGGQLMPGLSVAVDGRIALGGLQAAVGEHSEIRLLPALTGG